MQSRLTLSTHKRDGNTVLGDYFATPPLKLLTLPHHGDGVLHAMQMSSSPGLLAGDRIDIGITLAADSALHLSTQAFTRVLSMHAGQQAEQHHIISQAEGSCLTYLPHPLVLHGGSTLVQTTRIDLADRCRLIYGEITAAGRVLNGETFAFARFSSQLHIRHHGRLLVHDNICWQPELHHPAVLGQMEGYTHQATLFYADTNPDRPLKALLDRLYHSLSEQFSDGLLWGASLAADNIICLRALACRAELLQQLLQQAAASLQTQAV
ncbi:urease accessory protein UreD [Uruburuella testudinis]|uniref:Urease accessory protein UreD n=1 Tax=Uruburuella testudinis TaxID=1282863 RepID=A0ABY4DT61_9NEIS|nr:urease accessory protein UreD [Uruburuella testudinis]UOO82073.1 urease accessory protein UreD [Uruburuella testudinis]